MTATLIGSGLCACGCGQRTKIATKTSTARGVTKGEPLPYVHGHSGGRTITDPTERFWSQVDIGDPDSCWPWMGACNQGGYGKFWLDGQTIGAHRYALTTRVGPLGDGFHARHRCDNPPCCNPLHLEPGTPLDNVADRVERDRTPRGEGSARARLTAGQVDEARRRHAGGETHAAIAVDLGVARSTIQAAVSGRNWAGAR